MRHDNAQETIIDICIGVSYLYLLISDFQNKILQVKKILPMGIESTKMKTHSQYGPIYIFFSEFRYQSVNDYHFMPGIIWPRFLLEFIVDY